MQTGTIQRLIDLINGALKELHVEASLDEIEDLAVSVHRALTLKSRYFHTPEHIFCMAECADAVQALAALFHDIVYYQVDSGFTPDVQAVISPYIQVKEDGIYTIETRDPADVPFCMTLELFGFQAGQQLPLYGGLNEFLSALLMTLRLYRLVPKVVLAKAAVCVEATIPFRARNEQGVESFALLEDRLRQVNERYQLGMGEKEMEQAIQSAVVFANRDVESFSDRDPAHFLDGTWKLIPETNAALRSSGIYSIREYRQALHKMEGFFHYLDPDTVFHSYKGIPPQVEYQEMVNLARYNIFTAREYLGVKLLAIAVLEALAEISGGDAPVSLFMGDIEHNAPATRRIEDYLPEVNRLNAPPQQSVVQALLECGRASELDFDMKNSPLALFLYSHLGTQGCLLWLEKAKEMFRGEVSALKFLDTLEASVVAGVAQACAEMVVTRREALLAYAHSRVKKT
jgi:hypothetical protein